MNLRTLFGLALLVSALGCSNGDGSDAPSSQPKKTSRAAVDVEASDEEEAAPRETPEGEPEQAADAEKQAPKAGSAVSADAPQKDPPARFCRVLDVMRSDCQRCHAAQPLGGAPMPLVSYDDFMAKAVTQPERKVYELVRERVRDTARPMPPSPAQLSAAALTTIDEWVASGALAAAEDCAEPAPSEATSEREVEWPADCEERHAFVAHDLNDASKPYMVPANTEEHPQFAFDAPWGDAEVQMLATRPITDNGKVIHHWILWDAKERASLRGWAPGGAFETMPSDVGLYMPKGAGSLTLDMHYYNLNGTEPQPDASGVEVCITRKLRDKTAANTGLNGSATVAAMSRGETPVSCDVTTDAEVHFIGITPHMHQLGVHAKLELTRGGMTTALWDAPFSFHEQDIHALDNVHIMPGDVLTTTCTFVNDKPVDVAWGDSTDDEMCINWVRYYPRGAFHCRSMKNMQQP